MGINSFKSGSSPRSGSYGNQHTKKDSYIDGWDVIRTVEEAVKACKELKELDGFDGWPTVKEWNTYNNDIGTSTRANHLKRQCGKGLNGIKKLAGCDISNIEKKDISKLDVDIDILKCARHYGEDFTMSDMIDDEAYIDPRTIKRVTGHTFNERKIKLDLEMNSCKNISESEIKAEIIELINHSGYPVTTDKVDSFCSFSYHVVSRVG